MIDDIKLKKINELKEKISSFTHKEKSLLERYEINYTGMLIYSDNIVDTDFCHTHIRESDIAIALTPNLAFIIYSVVDGQDAMKAAQHILHNYQKKYPKQDIFIVLSSQDQKISTVELEERLVQLLQFAIEKKITNNIVTFSDIDRIFINGSPKNA